MNWLFARLGEASSWAGIAGLVSSFGQLVDFHQAAPIANVVGQVGQAVAAGSVSPLMALGVAAASIAAIFVPEKGSNG
jgi:hypothetical protein